MGFYLICEKGHIVYNSYTKSIWCVDVMTPDCPKQRNKCALDYECFKEVV